MAKITNPLHSISATGTVADTFTFRTQRGTNVVHKKMTPRLLQSTAQQERQAIYSGICSTWNTLDAGTKAGWEVIGKERNITGFNAYCSAELIAAYSTPARTYATWNPADKAAEITLSNGNLTATGIAAYRCMRATQGLTTGKHYWEMSWPSGMTEATMGIANATNNLNTWLGASANGRSVYMYGATNIVGSYGGTPKAFPGGSKSVATFHAVGIALDMDAKTLKIMTDVGLSGNIFWDFTGVQFPASSAYQTALTANFGQSAFFYQVPEGYNAGVYQ